MKVNDFVQIVNADFYTGVPDSQLKALCDYLMGAYGENPRRHIIAANEGNCAALAAGYHLATGKVPAVYMQNSGEGNIINPLASLLNDKVYGIPCIFIIGWRGEPGVHDEPQHIYQGTVTIPLLEDMAVRTFVMSVETTETELKKEAAEWEKFFAAGKQVSVIVKKGALEPTEKICYKNDYTMLREDIIKHIIAITGDDCVVSTTGKASRELFEIREANGQGHAHDFLTVGSMGHSSSIALGIALQKKEKRIWCIDGDGAALMHMGAMALIGANSPENLIHIILNNGSHETVGGMPTAADIINLVKIAEGCGYPHAACVNSFEELDDKLLEAKDRKELSFIEVKCAIGSRDDLGRPTTTPKENKEAFMRAL